MNRGQYQQRHRRGTRQAMHDTDQQRPERMKNSQLGKRAAQPARRRKGSAMMFRSRSVRMPVIVQARPVLMNVHMLAGDLRMGG